MTTTVSNGFNLNLSVCIPFGHSLCSYDKLTFHDLNGYNRLLWDQLGFWTDLCKRKMPASKFLIQTDESEFVERFPEFSLFYRLFSPLDSEMICIFPYFYPCEESAREIRGFFIKRCSLLYQEVLRNPALLFLLSERKCSLWY